MGAEAKSQESQNLRDLTRLFLALRKWRFFFVSYSRRPLGPALINFHLSSVTCLHFYLLFLGGYTSVICISGVRFVSLR